VRVLGAGVAEALAAIHAAGLIHRDLKPSNILLAEDGPHVIDFGIARAIDASGVTARSGTPGFMAPEVLLGRPLTSACDVFALGMVLAYAVGIRPFGVGPSEAIAYRVVHEEPDLSGLDPQIRGVVAACLAKESLRVSRRSFFASLLGARGIRVNAVAPGGVETDMSSFLKTDAGRDLVLGIQAFKRIAQPDDIGGVVAFLASDEARWITGDTIRVDGGSKL